MKPSACFGWRCSHSFGNAIHLARAGVFLLALMLAGARRAEAQFIWTGNTSTDWNTAANWNNSTVPTAGSNVSLNTGSGNQAVISTANATVNTLTVGADGNSTANTLLTIQSGFTLTTTGASIIGLDSGAIGAVLVTGSNTQWIASQNITVGKFATGNLTVANGGVVTAGDSLVADAFGGVGTVTVTGSHSALNITNVFYIGGSNSGNGSLTVANGGNVTAGFLIIGNITNAQGTALVTDANSTLKVTGGVNIGNSGTGSLTIANGGSVTSGGDFGVSSIDQLSQSGTLSVTGANSTLSINGNFNVGTRGGHGNVTIANGGQITGNVNLSMGEGGQGTGTMLVTGTNSGMQLTGGIFLGGVNTSLTVANGANVTAGSVLNLGTSFRNSTILITDANTTLHITGNINMGMGTVTVANGATMISDAGVVAGGFLNNAADLVVTDAHSTLLAGGNIVAGSGGNGNLTVTNGGLVSGNGALVIGDGFFSPGSVTGAVLVTGTNSTLQVAGDILAGDVFANNAGTGNLTVTSGGTVASGGNLIIGVTKNISGAVVVTGANSTLTVTQMLTVGANGSGNLTVANGGTVAVNGNNLTLASGADANATVNLQAGGTLEIGGTNGIQAGTGNYAFNFAGGTLATTSTSLTTSINASLASNSNSTINTTAANATWAGVLSGSGNLTKAGANALTLSGNNTYTGSTTVTGGTLVLANSLALQNSPLNYSVGNGNLSFGNLTNATLGGLSGDKDLALANANSAPVALTIGGSNLSTTYSGNLSGNGSLTVANGGWLTLSGNNTYTGSTTVNGGTLTISSNLDVGDSSKTLTITNGGKFSMGFPGNLYAGQNAGDNGTILVSGANSTLRTGSNGLIVGENGTGSLTVSNGGSVDTLNNALFLGHRNGTGTMLVTDANSTVTTGLLDVGLDGSGNLTVSNGGKIISTDNFEIAYGGTTSKVLVTGANSSITAALNIRIGDFGGGTLNVTNGGGVTGNGALLLGYQASANVLVTDPNSKLTMAGGITVGSFGIGVLFVGTGGTVAIGPGANLTLALNNGAGTLTLNEGTLQVGGANGIQAGAGTYAVNLIGGTLQVTNADLTTAVNATLVANSASTIDTNGFNATWSGGLSGTGGLVKAGAGTLTLSGNTTYTGNTVVSGGTLNFATNYTSNANATFSGNGSINGNVTINGTLRAGSAGVAGLLSFAQNLMLGANATSLFQIGGAARGTQYSAVNVTGGLVFGGTFAITLLNNFVPTLGATFDLFQFASNLTGSFSNLSLTPANLVYAWDTSQLATTGDISTKAINFSQWTAAAGLSGNNALPGAKPYSGPANLIRYAMNLDLTGAPVGAPISSTTTVSGTTYLVMEYRGRKNMTDCQLVPQYSVNLVDWTNVDAGNISPLSDADTYTARYQASVPFPEHGSVFLRVVAQAAP